ncbi:MAG: zinc ribbon domain-containing protein [Clostridiales bacterium]|jgi:rRNA maturation endonuclease Nob1|nr:zinc ribbon domain-containing protein [Clostridiales bacterium]
MEKIFEDLKKTVSRAAGTIAKKSGVALKISKLTLAISSANGDVKEEYEKIGKMIYAGYKDQAVSSDDVTARCGAIDAKLEEIALYRRQLNALKNTRICSSCGAEVSKESAFCAKCGEQL